VLSRNKMDTTWWNKTVHYSTHFEYEDKFLFNQVKFSKKEKLPKAGLGRGKKLLLECQILRKCHMVITMIQ